MTELTAQEVMTKNYDSWLKGDLDKWQETFHQEVAFIIQPSAAFTIPWAGIYVGFELVKAFGAVMEACMLWDKDKIFYGHFKPNSADPSNPNLCELDVNVAGTFAPTGNHFDFWMHYYVAVKESKLRRLVKTFDEAQVVKQFWGDQELPTGYAIKDLKLDQFDDLPETISPTMQTKWK